MASVSIRQTDRGAKALLGRLASAKGRAVTVGVHEGEGSEGKGESTIAEIAEINEFGMGPPARPVISTFGEAHEEEHRSNARRLGEAIVKGRVASVDQGLEQMALLYEGKLKEAVSAGVPPPNAPSTIARKGSSTPLIDTGQFRSSIRGKVRP